MQAISVGLAGSPFLLSAILAVVFSSAVPAEDNPNNCNGVDWDNTRSLVVSKIISRSRINFIKSPYDDDFKATACPADTDACRKKSYLVPGDLMLIGKTQGAFTCATYQSPLAREQTWVTGWLPSSALTSVAPMPSPKASDWIGTWHHPGGEITISRGDAGKLNIEGGMTVPTAHDFHTGELQANVTPEQNTIAFVDDGSMPFGKTEGECRVRIQRIGRWLLVEDNSGCGGATVTFTGLYRRKK